jgi:hypothetical protein
MEGAGARPFHSPADFVHAPATSFLWDVFAGWDVVSGYRERDIIGDMIAAI